MSDTQTDRHTGAPPGPRDRRHAVKKFALVLLGLGMAATAACTVPETNDALPEGSDQFPTEQKGAVETTTTVPAKAAPSSCDVTREALLTGTPAEITASMKALVAD